MKDFREIEIEQKNYEFVVIGGGVSGISTAIAAARRGVKTALITNRPVLGGNASSEIGININGACYNALYSPTVYARETGVVEELKQLIFDYEGYEDCKGAGLDSALFELIYREKNIDLYLNTHAFAVEKEGERIASVRCMQLNSERVYEFFAPLFAEASGDGLIGALAGADFMRGSESREEYGESLGAKEKSTVTSGSTVMFHSVDTGKPQPYKRPDFAYDVTKLPFFEGLGGKHRTFYKGKDGLFHGFWWVEFGGHLDTIKDDEAITLELRKIVYGLWDYIKNSGKFEGAETWKLVKVCPIAGKRESRRFYGDVVVTQNDIANKTAFFDAAYVGGWPMDVHADNGIYDSDVATNWHFVDGMYNLPYRSLYSRNVKNLFIVGRLTSCTRVANGSTRVMSTCAASGQAAGTAAALCLKHGVLPAGLLAYIEELKAELLKDDQTLMGVAENYALNGVKVSSGKTAKLSNPPVNAYLPLMKDRIIAIPCFFKTGRVKIFVRSQQPTELSVLVLGGARKENYQPERVLDSLRFPLAGGEEEISLPFDYPTEDGKLYYLFEKTDGISLRAAKEELTGAPCFTSWRREPTENDPRRFVQTRTRENIAFICENAPEIYGAENVLGGYNRPYFAPNVCLIEKANAFLELSFDRKHVEEIKLVFNTDLAEDIIYERSKKLVKDYDIELYLGDVCERRSVTGNIHRMNKFTVGRELDRVRIVFKENYGSEFFEIFGVKIY
ncbi:MAG: FAD-dependent oxidoreductase [Clostridia bacterium]|nr:FAD-dependent oxidoreductase [Clostridia bacterium]